MWNVYQYIKDCGNGKVPLKDFINIFNSQEVLRKFVCDTYDDLLERDLSSNFVKNTDRFFPSGKALIHFLTTNMDENVLRKICFALMLFADNTYKSNY